MLLLCEGLLRQKFKLTVDSCVFKLPRRSVEKGPKKFIQSSRENNRNQNGSVIMNNLISPAVK